MSARRGKKPHPKKPVPPGAPKAASSRKGQAQGDEDADLYTLVGGKLEAISLWLDSLSREEKREVLDVTATEVVDELLRLGQREITNLTKVDALLSDKDLMSTLRSEFVKALNNEGVMQKPSNVVELALYRVMESHLLFLYSETTVLAKLFVFVAYVVWNLEVWWWLRYPLVGLLFWLWWTEWPSFISEHRSKLLMPFRDNIHERMEHRTDAFLCGLLCAHWGSWLSWYVIAIIVCCLPLLLVEIEKLTSIKGGDQNGIRYIVVALLSLSCLQLLYLAWFSWTSFIFVAFLFFPKLSLIICTFVLYGLGFLTSLVDNFFDLLIDFQKHWLVLSIIFVLAIIAFFISGGWYRMFSVIFMIFFWPKVIPLSNLFVAAATQFATRGIRGTFVLLICVLLIGAVLVWEIFLRICCGKKSEEEEEESDEIPETSAQHAASDPVFMEEVGLD
eukprot:gb/GEZN01006415.1/.p1 GENE.gb/GEZN01006415.1/~~gb/GEZN01006415.1/.p1  ORF type:complete len:446 (+),score=51.65 gb/GEZN01006415.1/:20-1357(+)